MIPFVCLYVYLIFVYLFTKQIQNYDKRLKKQCILYFWGLLFLLGLHSPTQGVDVEGFYASYFETCINEPITFNFIGSIEPLFHAYTVLIRSFTDNVQVYLFVTAVIILVPVILLFYKESKCPYLSTIFYVSFILYYFSFSGLRQALAVSLVCVGFVFLMKEKWLLFILFVVIAFGFHTSAIFALIAVPLMKFKLPDYVWMVIFLFFAAVIAVLPSIMLVIVDLIFSDLGKYQSDLDEKGGGINLAFLYLSLALFQYYLAKKYHEKSMIQFTLLLFVIQLTGIRSSFASRIGYYFLPLMYVYIPNRIMSIKNKKNTSVLILCFTLFLVAFFIYSNSSGYLNVIPYKFCWE